MLAVDPLLEVAEPERDIPIRLVVLAAQFVTECGPHVAAHRVGRRQLSRSQRHNAFELGLIGERALPVAMGEADLDAPREPMEIRAGVDPSGTLDARARTLLGLAVAAEENADLAAVA